MKNKFDFAFRSEIEGVKIQHLNHMETMEYEISKLKEVINSKNMEIEQLLTKSTKVKGNYEDSISLIQR